MEYRISSRTLAALQRVITGNEGPDRMVRAPYRSGTALTDFFREFTFPEDHPTECGGWSRWKYAEDCLRALNGTEQLPKVFELALAPSSFHGTHFKQNEVAMFLNGYLQHDGLRLVRVGTNYSLRSKDPTGVVSETPSVLGAKDGHAFIAEQLAKCDRKLAEGDLDGAITNARALVEAVLVDIESRLVESPDPYDGELTRLFKRVQQLLHLDPERKDVSDPLKQLLRGLVNIIGGLAPMRNKMSDSHVRSYKPCRHHAKLAVNSAKTFVDFIYDTFQYQLNNNLIKEV